MPDTEFMIVAFGSSYTGLEGDVGYAIYDTDGTLVTDYVTDGVTERGDGSGQYGALIEYPTNFVGEVRWTTGGVSPVYVSAAINNNVQNYHAGGGVRIA